MSKKRQKRSKPWLTREFFISSTLIILVISGVLFGAWLLLREPNPNHIVEDAEWLEQNIWRVQSYREKRNGKFDIYLLAVEPPHERSFEELEATFLTSEYSSFNSYYLQEGVNCQGMVCYLASWCERYHYEYSVAWNRVHTLIYIKHEETGTSSTSTQVGLPFQRSYQNM